MRNQVIQQYVYMHDHSLVHILIEHIPCCVFLVLGVHGGEGREQAFDCFSGNGLRVGGGGGCRVSAAAAKVMKMELIANWSVGTGVRMRESS